MDAAEERQQVRREKVLAEQMDEAYFAKYEQFYEYAA